ncbi:hypothetical protein BC830DRAFT_1164095 [Chytriomyces sp. MP71]|nr:hypothetical protein BC830DRAFT_1164095 [Chytriomyces sp. MP71]
MPRKLPHPCQRCFEHRRKCDRAKPLCERCFCANASCSYDREDRPKTVVNPDLADAPMHGSKVSPSTSVVDLPAASGPCTLLSHIAAAAESSHLENVNAAPEPVWDLLDSDLIPSLADYYLVKAFMSVPIDANGVTWGQFLNGDAILQSFFVTSAPLRFVLCLAALLNFQSSREFKTSVQMSYFRRARKALQRHLQEPSFETLLALHLLGTAAKRSGQLDFAKSLQRLSLEMLLAIELHVDPGSSRHRAIRNLPEKAKYARRAWFWEMSVKSIKEVIPL